MTEQMTHSIAATNLADILERVLDKGIVIAGDIKIQIANIDLLNIKIRLLIASVDKAMEMGIGKEELEESAALAVAFSGCRALMLWNELKKELKIN